MPRFVWVGIGSMVQWFLVSTSALVYCIFLQKILLLDIDIAMSMS